MDSEAEQVADEVIDAMSGSGIKRTSAAHQSDFRFWHLADMPFTPMNVRFWG
jgi:hypothetical protein